MLIGELAKRVGRHVDTLKRWEEAGLLVPNRDYRGRRTYGEEHFEQCLALAKLSIAAQKNCCKLAKLASQMPQQLALLERHAS
jgi:DNA-binding transcriptional MerR regulator